MVLKLRLRSPERLVGDARTLAEAAARGLEVCVRRHLRAKDLTASHRPGFPRSGYYADAARDVEASVEGTLAAVEASKEGLALHYEGGTVYPRKKALAIPVDPSVADIWPSEANALATGDGYALVWPRGSDHGFIKDAETNDLLWLLVPKATIKADPTVFPTDAELLDAAEAAIWSALA